MTRLNQATASVPTPDIQASARTLEGDSRPMGWSAAENASASIKLESTRAAGFSTQANRALAIVRNGKGGREEIAQLTGFLDLQTGELPPLDPMRFVIRATIESLARIAAETEARPES